MHTTDVHEVLQWSSIELVPINMRLYLSFSIALVPQMQLQHLRWSVSAQSAGDVHSQVLDFPLCGRLCANCRKTLASGGHRPDNVPCIPVHQYQIDYYITACHPLVVYSVTSVVTSLDGDLNLGNQTFHDKLCIQHFRVIF
jgi:hypothetical protein